MEFVIEGEALESARLRGGVLKVGDEFRWIDPKEMEFRESPARIRTQEIFIKKYGPGPFKAIGIKRLPAGHVMVKFADSSGEVREINIGYFRV